MWKIRIHKLVIEEDFKKIDEYNKKVILKTIEKKLKVDPKGYGSKLRYELNGFLKLKISKYRVIYKIEEDRVLVLVLKIGIRRDEEVYREMMKRIEKVKY